MKSRIREVSKGYKPSMQIRVPLHNPLATEIDPLKIAPIKYQITVDGREIYLSEPYLYKNYPCVIGYVDNGEGALQPRLFYFSKSHALWRVAPILRESGAFAKGYSHFSCDLPPLLNMDLMIKFENETNAPQKLKSSENFDKFIEVFFKDPSLSRSDEFTLEFKNSCHISPTRVYDIPSSDFITGQTLKPVENRKPTSLPQNVGDLPDFNSLVTVQVKNTFYAEHLIKGPLNIHTCVSQNGKIRYLFADGENKKTGKQCCFLLSMAPEPPEINSYGVASNMINLGYLSITPLMRAVNLKDAGLNMQRGDYEIRTYDVDMYCQVSDEYMAALPLNEAFTKSRAEKKVAELETTASTNDNYAQPRSDKSEEVDSTTLKPSIAPLTAFIAELSNCIESLRKAAEEKRSKLPSFLSSSSANAQITAATKLLTQLQFILENVDEKVTFNKNEISALRKKPLLALLQKYKEVVPAEYIESEKRFKKKPFSAKR